MLAGAAAAACRAHGDLGRPPGLAASQCIGSYLGAHRLPVALMPGCVLQLALANPGGGGGGGGGEAPALCLLAYRLVVLPVLAVMMSRRRKRGAVAFRMVLRGMDERLQQLLPESTGVSAKIKAQHAHTQGQWQLKDGQLFRKDGGGFGLRLVYLDEVPRIAFAQWSPCSGACS